MAKPTVIDLERTLRRCYPEVGSFPLVRTLATAAWELGVSQRELLRVLPGGRRVLWYYRGKTYVPPDVYERWRRKLR